MRYRLISRNFERFREISSLTQAGEVSNAHLLKENGLRESGCRKGISRIVRVRIRKEEQWERLYVTSVIVFYLQLFQIDTVRERLCICQRVSVWSQIYICILLSLSINSSNIYDAGMSLALIFIIQLVMKAATTSIPRRSSWVESVRTKRIEKIGATQP